LEREPDAEFLYHVGLALIVEIDLNGAGAQHHVEAHAPHTRHMPQHDVIATLGHDRQFFTGLVGPHAQPEIANPAFLADRLHLLQMPPGFRASLVQVFQRRTR